MAITPRIPGNNLNLALDGQAASPLRSLQPPAYRLDRSSGAPPGGSVIRAGTMVTLGEMAAEFGPEQPGPLRDWAVRFAGGDLAPQSGVAQVCDFNMALRRSLAFEGAEITQLRLTTLSATDGRTALLLGLTWRMQAFRESVGDGHIVSVSGGRPKAMLAGNFRVSGLPFDSAGILRVGLPLLRRVDAATDPRQPRPKAGALDLGELALTVGMRAHDKALAWVQQVAADGQLADKERLDIVVELLDASLKTVLASVQLLACSLLACDESLLEAVSETPPSLVLRFAVGAVALSFSKG